MTKEQAYDSLVNPLMARIIATCKEHKIPMLASFSLDAEEDLYCTTSLLSEEWEPPESLVAAAREILSGSYRQPNPLQITTRNANGEITAIETII